MKPIELIPITKDFRIFVVDDSPWSVSDKLEQQVNHIWKSEGEKRDLKEQNTLTIVAMEKNLLFARFIPYKYVLAMHTDPSIKKELNLTTVGVTGLTECDGHLLIGKRSDQVTQYKNCYETAPSGGIEEYHFKEGKVDYLSQVLDELEEETEIPREEVKSIKEEFLAYDFTSQSIDVCIRMDLDPSVMNSVKLKKNDEYSELEWIHESQLPEALKKGEWIPLAKELCTFIKAL